MYLIITGCQMVYSYPFMVFWLYILKIYWINVVWGISMTLLVHDGDVTIDRLAHSLRAIVSKVALKPLLFWYFYVRIIVVTIAVLYFYSQNHCCNRCWFDNYEPLLLWLFYSQDHCCKRCLWDTYAVRTIVVTIAVLVFLLQNYCYNHCCFLYFYARTIIVTIAILALL
jgi:hypothetical protein